MIHMKYQFLFSQKKIKKTTTECLFLVWNLPCVQQVSHLEGGPLMWMLPLYLYTNQKSDDDDDDENDDDDDADECCLLQFF